jgi:putative endonuclease
MLRLLLSRFGVHADAERTPRHLQLGKQGEAIACRYLRRHGYRIRGRNLRVGRRDEIDILAFDPRDAVLVFAEVKTRAIADPDYPAELAFSREKKKSVIRAARRWVLEHGYDGGYRIDLLTVEGGSVTEHLQEVGWE